MAGQIARKVPPIRFKAFEAKWEDEKIGSVLAEKRRPIALNDHQRYELITVKRRNEGVVSRGHLLGRDILVKNYAQLQAGDFVISKRQVVHGATGMVPPELDGAIVSNEYLTAVDSEKLLTEFLTIAVSLPAMRRKFFLSSYGVDIEKLFFDAEDWKKREFTLPSKAEQAQIGLFFRQLDLLIGLHQSKHDKLRALKKAMLEKMFPKPGACTPQIRFKGFSKDWVEMKLKALGTFNPKEDLPEVFEYVDLESVVGTEMVGHRTMMREAAPSRAQRLARRGDLFFQTVRPYQKNNYLFTLLGSNYVFSTGYAQIRPFDSGSFLLALMQRDSFVKLVLDNCTGTSYPAINANVLSEMTVAVPLPDEQEKIGTYFSTLDMLISQHATQLLQLKRVKAACMGKMFA
ncbi:restriction endonuclease subunit S [Cupriavidus alkaliphilus]|uniref:restriction endonuclease subunit S n=1 Tax=Cupriavidus alkaliphilus TaxID=942866 RepID=UPI0016082FD2|nr:restriction endonuclease subunit S [Cupriavidus alkaliphilus]MBB2920459.1 type I restriction enzyme S subunit [Cupriavidus alkaliphilus]